MTNTLAQSEDYRNWLTTLKAKVRQSQLKAAVAVNQELLTFYWELGAGIVEKQKDTAWGGGFLKQLSHDLMEDFTDMKGFSERNLKYIRQWFLFWTEHMPIGQQPVAQLSVSVIHQIPMTGAAPFIGPTHEIVELWVTRNRDEKPV